MMKKYKYKFQQHHIILLNIMRLERYILLKEEKRFL